MSLGRIRVVVFASALAVLCPAVEAHEPQSPRPRIGLALGGGSARGLAHIGVLKWMEEHRVPVDAIAGTSMGAFVGGIYATGATASEIQENLRREDWDAIVAGTLPYSLRSFRRKEDYRDFPIKLELGLRHGLRLQGGLNSGHGLGLLLSRMTLPYSTVEKFDDLAIPFRCVATDMEAGESVVLDRGPLAPALRASMALPGTFDPVLLGDSWLSDGGILNNNPVDVARSMGVDVVIAVSVAKPVRDKRSEGLRAVANRAIQLMMAELDRARLASADVLVLPDVEDVGGSAFASSDDIIARGYAAAAAKASELSRYSLSEEEWAAYRARLSERRKPRHAPFAFVEVRGVSDVAAEQIAHRLQEDLARSTEPSVVDSNIDWLIGHGQYASAMYGRRMRGDQEGLAIDVRDKSYAPPLVKFAVDLDNENQDINLTMGSRITVLNATSLGSEVRIDGAVGSTMRVGGELLQPIGRGFMRRGPFLAPRASYVRSSENVYRDDEIAAIYNRQRASAGVDAGWLFGRDGQIRAGYEIGYVKNTARVGNVFPSAEGRENSFHAGFDIDRQDRAYFPSSGFRAHGGVRWFMDAPAAPESFGIVEGSLSSTWSIGKGRHLSVFADGGGNIGAEPPLLYQFGVGGPARLAAFAPNAFRGPKFLSGGVGIRTTIARLPGLLGDRLYATARTEIGAAFTSFDTARYRKSVTAGLEADTIFGPFFLGASVGDDRAFRAYFLVGKSVR